jgi:hypothetical protein
MSFNYRGNLPTVTYIREAQASNLGQENGYRDWNFPLDSLFHTEHAAISWNMQP